jgi:hypothetical protein
MFVVAPPITTQFRIWLAFGVPKMFHPVRAVKFPAGSSSEKLVR